MTPDKPSLDSNPALLSAARNFSCTTRLEAHPFVPLFDFHCHFKHDDQTRYAAWAQVPYATRKHFDAMQQMDDEPEPGVATILAMCHTRELAYQIRNEYNAAADGREARAWCRHDSGPVAYS